MSPSRWRATGSGSCPFQRERPGERSSGDYPRRQLQPMKTSARHCRCHHGASSSASASPSSERGSATTCSPPVRDRRAPWRVVCSTSTSPSPNDGQEVEGWTALLFGAGGLRDPRRARSRMSAAWHLAQWLTDSAFVAVAIAKIASKCAVFDLRAIALESSLFLLRVRITSKHCRRGAPNGRPFSAQGVAVNRFD